MTPSEIIGGCGLLFTVVTAMIACTWHLSAKLTVLTVTLRLHATEDDGKFARVNGRVDELFRWVSDLSQRVLGRSPGPALHFTAPAAASALSGDDET